MKNQKVLVGAVLVFSSLLSLSNAFASPKWVLGLGGDVSGSKNGLSYQLKNTPLKVPENCKERQEDHKFVISCPFLSSGNTGKIQREVVTQYSVAYKNKKAVCEYTVLTALTPGSEGSKSCIDQIIPSNNNSNLCRDVAKMTLSGPNGCSTYINFL